MRMLLFIFLISLFSCHNNEEKDPTILTQLEYFRAIEENDVKLAPPKEGEWLFEHKEKGQSFDEYKKGNPIRPHTGKSVIYLMPVGDFTLLQEKTLQLTRDYIAIFFQQKTVLLKAVSDSIIPTSATRQQENHVQLLAPYVLDSLLIGKTPEDGIALMAISAKDLYPKKEWNYVFGLASYAKRVGVSSIYRLQNQLLDSANFLLCLSRLINISSHEIGHMMAIQHCTFARCIMNGSNSLSETDTAPNRLCSECQKKLFWNFKYDNKKRLKELYDFCQENGLQRDFSVLKQDWEAVE
ncbi:archaemetzincin [Chitinophaga sp. RAB17]|uniref:archaemetzincin n=1 Tax=Chitinophaga sp. RAB17 TaxID=3233049 RepID=UPI003F8F92C9